MTYINPKWILTEFLRKNLTDPRTSRIPTQKELTFTATASQTTFQLTFSSGKGLSYINEVKVEGVTQTKWVDYYINFRNNQIVFFYGITEDDEVYVDLYETTTDWIYWDTLDGNLSPENYPRITIQIAAGSGIRVGNYEAPVESYIDVQFDIYAKEKSSNQIFTIDGKKYTGEELAERIAYDIMDAFNDHEDELHPALYNYVPSQFPPRFIPFDEKLQAHHKIIECELSAIDIGRI